MKANVDASVSVVIPNWNGRAQLAACLNSLLKQSLKTRIVVIDNGSSDGSIGFIRENYPNIEVLSNGKNLGFAGGVNVGIRRGIDRGDEFVALLNNDAVANKYWLQKLLDCLKENPESGIAICKILSSDGTRLDSTGDYYTSWGLPFPRGRGERASDKYDKQRLIFAASGGASLYRVSMLKEIGLFDEDFFAYYEDVDLSFRAQLAGWRVRYEPAAIVYHQIGATSGKIKGFATYQTMKNLPYLLWKNIPLSLLPHILPRFIFAYFMLWGSAVLRGQAWPSTKGAVVSIFLWPKKMAQRHKIQKSRKVSAAHINSIIIHDLPPNASKLRKLRNTWWKISERKVS